MCLGAIIGDIVGSPYEGRLKPENYNFRLFNNRSCFTDDTVLTLAVADAVLNGKDYAKTFKEYYKKYPYVGYGKKFRKWAKLDSNEKLDSWGNGSAMRISPIAYIFDTEKEVLNEVTKATIPTHNSTEGIKGAQAVALAIFMARKGASMRDIYDVMTERFKYDLMNVKTGFYVSCQESVPQALVAFLSSVDFIDTIRKAIMFMGDADTLACIAGSIAQPYYKLIHFNIIKNVFERLPEDLAYVVVEFTKKYIDNKFVAPASMSENAKLYNLYRRSLVKNDCVTGLIEG